MHRSRIIALAICATFVALWVVVRPDQFWVERVVFEGNVRATPAELRHLADIRNGTTIWGVDLDRVSSNVRRHPWVKRVEAERRLPSTVVVRLEEYAPVAMLSWHDRLWYVDGDGEPFLEASSDDLDHPVITGIDDELEAMHPNLPRLAIKDALWLVGKLDEGALLARDRISEIRFDRTHGWTILASGGRPGHPPAEVLFGLPRNGSVVDYERQLRRLGTLVAQDLVDLDTSTHVDLGAERVAIVRPVETGPLPPIPVPPTPEPAPAPSPVIQ